MNDINVSFLHQYLSGSASNASHDDSLGGEISDHRIECQTATGISILTGVTIDFAAGNAEGNGSLEYDVVTSAFTWTPPGGTVGVAVTADEDGSYAVTGLNGNGLICITVDFSSLPVSSDPNIDTIAVTNIKPNFFDAVAKADSFSGDTEYRCLYLKNTHPDDTLLDIVLFVGQQPTPGTMSIGLDPAGVGDGSITGVATTIANENTAPAGVTFTTPTTEPAGLHVVLDPGETQAVWIRRVIAARNTVANDESVFILNQQVYF